MGTGERSWDGVAAVMMRRGCWSEADPISVQTDIRGRTHNPNQGVLIQSQLVWLYRTQDIYFRAFVSIFRFYFQSFSFFYQFPLLFVIFEQFCRVGPWAGATGRSFLVKQRKGTGEFLHCTLLPSFFNLVDLIMSAEKTCAGFSNQKPVECGSRHI